LFQFSINFVEPEEGWRCKAYSEKHGNYTVVDLENKAERLASLYDIAADRHGTQGDRFLRAIASVTKNVEKQVSSIKNKISFLKNTNAEKALHEEGRLEAFEQILEVIEGEFDREV